MFLLKQGKIHTVRNKKIFLSISNIYCYILEDELHGLVFVRLQLACNNHIEYAYYSSSIGRNDICCYCATERAERDKEALKTHKIVLPLCSGCKAKKKPVLKRNPLPKK